MFEIHSTELPAESYLHAYRERGAYTDGFVVVVAGRQSLARYIEAFYTTPLFKLERMLLGWFARCPSSDDDARGLARGDTTRFSAWHVEARGDGQILLCDFRGETRSWLMCAEAETDTRLYFGSAVVPHAGTTRMGWDYRLLLGFHVRYSRALLRSAAKRLRSIPAERGR